MAEEGSGMTGGSLQKSDAQESANGNKWRTCKEGLLVAAATAAWAALGLLVWQGISLGWAIPFFMVPVMALDAWIILSRAPADDPHSNKPKRSLEGAAASVAFSWLLLILVGLGLVVWGKFSIWWALPFFVVSAVAAIES